ncbi:sigma factor-like helix-turn-helix DNA-binding protein [Streptomyces sp. NPDC058678]|uniref:sigma factor-like helix-turn-helix DNA-binding protein n=1 Tax=Streptomyces sp. NPDC058678 TaxID=3346595 RepID=UPI0036462FBB
MRFFCEMTQNRVALQFGLSQMHVSRLNHPHLCAPARPGDGRSPRSQEGSVTTSWVHGRRRTAGPGPGAQRRSRH